MQIFVIVDSTGRGVPVGARLTSKEAIEAVKEQAFAWLRLDTEYPDADPSIMSVRLEESPTTIGVFFIIDGRTYLHTNVLTINTNARIENIW